jgi:hypothetical protein
MVKPIKPGEVSDRKRSHLPDEIIEAFNDAIASYYYHGEANFTQEYIISQIVRRGIGRKDIEGNHLLQGIEEIYRPAGWIVTFNAPAYNETYMAYYSFKKDLARGR